MINAEIIDYVKKQVQAGVSQDKIKSDFEKNGKAIINQLNFDSGKATLQVSSNPVILEIAKFLKENPSLKIFVVGHTDNTGGYDFNLSLSQHRAETVVKELQSKHLIPPDRLKAKGVGYLCPVASNDTEQGKTKNRRVELVKQ
jgi:outer membrane protein OmpA-like peptidoglycan-associated protein